MNSRNIKFLNWNIFSENRAILMGFAIVMIVVFHWCENYKILHAIPSKDLLGGVVTYFMKKMIWIGACGVEIFLFLSGIGLFFSYSNQNDGKAFVFKQFVKVLVPYVLLAFPYLIWQNFIFSDKGFLHFLSDLTLLTTFQPFNRQSWYVALILFMYILFPLFYYVRTKCTDRSFYLLLAYFVLLPWLVQSIDTSIFNRLQIALTRIPTFLLGVYCGKLVYEKKDIVYYPIFLVVSVFVTKYIYIYQKANGINTTVINRYGKAVIVLLFLLLLAALFHYFKTKCLEKFFLFFAPITLELYVSHVEMRRVFFRVLEIDGNTISVTLAYLAIIIVCIPVSLIVNKISKRYINKILSC